MSKFSRIYNPFDYIAGGRALLVGGLFLGLSIFTAFYCNGRYDGVLNLHFAEDVSLAQVVFDQSVNFLSLILMLFIMGWGFGAKGTRLIDVAGTTTLAMAPLSIAPLININGFFYQTSEELLKAVLEGEALDLNGTTILALTGVSLLQLLLIVWTVALLFHAYKTSTNLKSGKLAGSFILALLVSMIVSIYLTRNFSF